MSDQICRYVVPFDRRGIYNPDQDDSRLPAFITPRIPHIPHIRPATKTTLPGSTDPNIGVPTEDLFTEPQRNPDGMAEIVRAALDVAILRRGELMAKLDTVETEIETCEKMLAALEVADGCNTDPGPKWRPIIECHCPRCVVVTDAGGEKEVEQ